MTSFKKSIVVAAFLISATQIAGFSESTHTTKINPALSIMTLKGADTKRKKNVETLSSVVAPKVKTILRFRGNLSGVKELGGEIGSVIGDIATVTMPLSAVHSIAELQNIVYIEAAKRVKPRLNLSTAETQINQIRSDTAPNLTGATGYGVVIGIIDTGIDLAHLDFKDTTGKTRVLFLWDQAAATGANPSGFTYGNECTKTMIDLSNCTAPSTKDTAGHGTHVAGIAAGNGQATGNGQAAYRFIGMAPHADLIIVNTLNAGGQDIDLLNAIAYIQAKAKLLGKPSVINLSLGSHIGAHDGTSLYEQALNNASGSGKIIVGAAGNEGDEAATSIHASGTVSHGKTVDVNIDAWYDMIDIWYAGSDQISVSMRDSSSICNHGPVAPGETKFFATSCGNITISSSDVLTENGDREIQIEFESVSTVSNWVISLTGTSIISPGRFDMWSTWESSIFLDHVDSSMTLIDTATAEKTIAVSAYIVGNII